MRVINAREVDQLLDMASCIRAIEDAFRALGEGRASSSIGGLELTHGGLHAKMGVIAGTNGYAAAKVNANFPDNPSRHGLPTVQGVVIVFDGATGTPLACMNSGPITATRTAAASAVAASYLALPNADSVAFVGCGVQAKSHAIALRHVRPIRRIFAFDKDRSVAERFAREVGDTVGVETSVVDDHRKATKSSQIVVTSTPSRQAILNVGDVGPGAFIAAVGADNEHKQEISSELLRSAAVIVDDLGQCSAIGDLHHALSVGLMKPSDVRASLDQVVTGRIPGRLDDQEIIVFDSTGIAIEDVAAAAIIYERAKETNVGADN